MKIEVKIDASCEEPKILLITNKMTDEVSGVLKKLSGEAPPVIAGFRGDTLEILEQPDIFRVFASAGKVIAETPRGEFLLRQRLYELEERLDKSAFVRISNSEIINLKKVRGFDLSFTGTICVTLSNGTVTYVSRRYGTKIKQVLGIWGEKYEKESFGAKPSRRAPGGRDKRSHNYNNFVCRRGRKLLRRGAPARRRLRERAQRRTAPDCVLFALRRRLGRSLRNLGKRKLEPSSPDGDPSRRLLRRVPSDSVSPSLDGPLGFGNNRLFRTFFRNIFDRLARSVLFGKAAR